MEPKDIEIKGFSEESLEKLAKLSKPKNTKGSFRTQVRNYIKQLIEEIVDLSRIANKALDDKERLLDDKTELLEENRKLQHSLHNAYQDKQEANPEMYSEAT